MLVDFELDTVLQAVMDAGGVTSLPEGVRLQDTAKVVEVETGAISDADYLAEICSAARLELSMDQLVGAWQRAFQLNPTGMALFHELREQGHPVHILSNLAWHNMEAVRRNWPDFFERTTENFFSYELGFHKPDERIYRTALEQLGAKPDECFFLDDRSENVEGARALGFNAHVFNAKNLPAIREALARFTTE